jgi:hypothetical protein
MGFDAERPHQWAEDVLPFEEAIGKEIHACFLLHANESGLIVGKGLVDGIRAHSTAVDAASRDHHLLRSGIDAVLIRQNFDGGKFTGANYNALGLVIGAKGFRVTEVGPGRWRG